MRRIFFLILFNVNSIFLFTQNIEEKWMFESILSINNPEKENLKPGDQGFRYHKLNQGKLMPLVVKTIQEQQKVIEELKLEIEKLKNKCQK